MHEKWEEKKSFWAVGFDLRNKPPRHAGRSCLENILLKINDCFASQRKLWQGGKVISDWQTPNVSNHDIISAGFIIFKWFETWQVSDSFKI